MKPVARWQLQSQLGWPLIFLLALIPIPLWFNSAPLESRFIDLTSSLADLGRLAGLTGLAMLSLTLILSARWKWVEPWFGGMNRSYIAHHLLSALAFSLLLFHPLLIVMPYLEQSPRAAMEILLPMGIPTAETLPIFHGRMALFILIALVVLTLYVKLPYHIWKLTHKFMPLAFLLAGLHAITIPSDIALPGPLRWYLLTLVGIGLFASAYRLWLWRYLARAYWYKVESVNRLGSSVTEVILRPESGHPPMTHIPGQFMFVRFLNDNTVTQEAHPFSITSGSPSPLLRFSAKALGDYTNTLPGLKPGATTRVEGPFGNFTLESAKHSDHIWVAGGIGITPFMALARSLPKAGLTVDLYYSARTPDELVYLDELKRISTTKPWFRVFPFIASERGLITADYIERTSKSLNSKDVFICGPPPMMAALRKQFETKGVRRRRIHTEEFTIS